MKKRNRFLALALALVVAAQPMGVQAEAFVDVEAAEFPEEVADVSQEEAAEVVTDVPEETASSDNSFDGVFTDGISEAADTEESIFSAPDEAGSAVTDGSEEEILLEEYEEVVLESPLIVSNETGGAGFSLFALAEYNGSYGAQLDGQAKEVYDIFVKRYVTDYKEDYEGDTVNYGISLQTPITFDGVWLLDESTQRYQLVRDENYQDARSTLKSIMQAAVDAFLYDYPEVFWMRGGSYSYGFTGGAVTGKDTRLTSITGITFKPQIIYSEYIKDGSSDSDVKTQMGLFEAKVAAAVEEIQAGLSNESTPYDKVKAIHDYVCGRAFYDTPNINNLKTHCAGPFFIGGGGVVCEGYAKAMKILCSKFDIQSACVSGGATSVSGGTPEAHMWNYILMENGEWYLTDATWDDQSTIRQTYLLAGRNSDGFCIPIFMERTNKNTFSTSASGDFTPMAFTYPVLSEDSYRTDTEAPGISISGADVSIETQQYTGQAVQPEVVVDLNETTLTENTDYTIEFYNNINLGTAVVLIKGTGNYKGTLRREFQIQCFHPQEDYQHINSVSVSCTTAGNTEYWYCGTCDRYFSDAAGNREIQLSETILGAAGHDMVYTPAVAPACVKSGNSEYWQCKACHKYFSDSMGTAEISFSDTVLPPTGHEQMIHTSAVSPTCTEEGNTEYWQCVACKKFFGNEEGAVGITEVSTILPATGHHYGAYQVTKEATALETGTETASCTCGAVLTREIPKLTATMSVNISSLRLRVRQTFRIRVTGLAKGDKVQSWSSSNSKVATVSRYGTVKGKKSGNAVITVKLASGKYRRIRVRVQKGTVTTQKLTLNRKRIYLKRRKSYTLQTTVTPVTSQQKVTYTSSNKRVAIVNSKGKITARAKGTAVITVRSGSKKITCRVTVK